MRLLEFYAAHPAEALGLLGEHLLLVLVSTAIAVAVGVPLGVLLTRRRRLAGPVLAAVNAVQTVPSLAVFGFLIPLPLLGGIGARTAIVALVLYALLPVVRNTVTGIRAVDPAVREAALGMGLADREILFMVELPLAAGVIFAGVRVAAVVGVGIATIGAAIGAGGLGVYIFRGVASVNDTLILAGALPAAALALALDAGLGWLERRVSAIS